MPSTIAVFTNQPDLKPRANELALQLHLPLAEDDSQYEYVLLLKSDYLGLKKTNDKTKALYVNFVSGKMQYRRHHATVRREILARAVGLHNSISRKDQPYRVIDTTAGLARDSFILASLGCHIQLLERSPIIFALIKDGMERARTLKELQPIIDRMTLIQDDAIAWLKHSHKPVNAIYIDPMFPSRKKTAFVKKDMQLFQSLLGPDEDSEKLFQAALACTTERVVVKRPRLAPEITGLKPSFSLLGKSSRFDIYLKR